MLIRTFLAYLMLSAALNGATVTVSSETQLINAINSSNAGDVIILNGGTYNLSSSARASGDPNICIDLGKSITMQSAAGAVPVINCTSAFGIRIKVSNVTLEGLTIAGVSLFGVQAQDDATHNQISNIRLRRLTVSTIAGSTGQAISLAGVVDSIVENCSILTTDDKGIALSQVPGGPGGSNRNLIINNTVQNTKASGITVLLSDYNVIAGNAVSNTGFDGIFVIGGQHNYIAQNTIYRPHNGVTLTIETISGRQSNRNYVGNNLMILQPSGNADPIWFNYDSDYNMSFLNEGSGGGEEGFALFNSVGNYIRGNNLHNNNFGGIFVTKDPASGPTVPTHNSVQQNYFHNYPANGGITTAIETQNDFGFNYMSGDPSQIGTPISGIFLNRTTNSVFYSNVIRDIRLAEVVRDSTSSDTFYLNRHFNTISHFIYPDSSASFDSGSTTLGGNYYSDFTSANGNPSNGATPFTNITDTNGTPTGTQDRYPYASENLGKTYSIAMRLPSAGSYLAIGSSKTISWLSQSCIAVDLFLLDNTNGVISTIASNAPDYGYYRWTVPNISAGTYKIRADCKNSAGAATGRTSIGPAFQATTPDLILLSPQANLMIDSGTSLQVSWAKSANVPSVDIYIRYSDAQAFTLLTAGVTNNFYTLPTPATSSNRASVRIAYAGNSDSTDGWFTIRASAAGQFTSPATTNNLYIGTSTLVEWVAPQNTDYVTLDLVGSSTKNIVTQLGDFSNYLMLVPDAASAGAQLQLTFFNASGSILQQISSPAQKVQNSSLQPDTINASAGNGQFAVVNAAFGTPLQVLVTNNGNPVPGAAVLFAAPGTGASGSFSGGTTILTNASGIAIAPAFVANGVIGAYNVTATTGSLSTAFTLTNTAAIASSHTNVGYFLNGSFSLDANGSGVNEGPPQDKFFFYVNQQAGDIAVVGDWNGDGRTKAGIYRDGFWILDYNGNGVYDYDGSAGKDRFYALGGSRAGGYLPVVGDWNGDGRTKIGFYINGFWCLDYNGNGTYDGTGPGQDRFFGFGGNPNEFPLLGDWNHDGRTKVGVFSRGNFMLDYDGDGATTAADKFYSYTYYTTADKPVTGDWSGNGFTKIGINRNGFWILDYNGNGVYDGIGPGGDKFYAFGGNAGEVPIVGDWNGDGRTKVGFYLHGFWSLDFNGNGSFDGTGPNQDRFIAFGGNAGEQPILGKW